MTNYTGTEVVKKLFAVFAFTCIFLFSSCATKDENNVAVKESTVTSSEEFANSQKKDVVISESNAAVEETAAIFSEESIDSQETAIVIPEPQAVDLQAAEEEYTDKIWGTEYILEIGYEYYDFATQEDIIHIGQLSHLKRLKISVDKSEIDLSPLGNLSELESLDIQMLSGRSPDLSFVENLGQLRELRISHGGDVDLSPLGSLNQLKKLSMSTWWGDANDLSFLRDLDQLTEVEIFKCEVEDLSLFQNMLCLQRLYVSFVNDCDLNYLANLKNLESLDITGGNIRNSEGLGNLTHLKSLCLYEEARYGETKSVMFDMQPIANLTELEWINLVYVYIEDISSLANLKGLRHIFLVDTDVSDISSLKDLENLNDLSIYGNESELVKEQAETYFNRIDYMVVTEEIPLGI